MTVIETSRTEICDLCPGTGRYSAFIQWEGRRQHGGLCDSCYDRHGDGRLGVGNDMYLLTAHEVPETVRAVCAMLTDRLGRPSLWAGTEDA